MEFTVNKQKITNYFELPSLKLSHTQASYTLEDALYKATIPMVAKGYIFGIEVEVENIPAPVINAIHRQYWNIVEDHSLRDGGAEYVSIPLRADQVEGALTQLKNNLPKNRSFSPRTSVHVHMNVRDLTMEEVTNLVLLYTIFEELLFDWAGAERTKNVFCVRLTDTDYVSWFKNLQEDPRQTVHDWNKYTALNLHPMQSKGTVEFRHMAGTDDVERITTWVNILSCLKNYAKNNRINHMLQQMYNLNSTSMYELFLYEVFGEYSKYLLPKASDLKTKMENAVSYIKLVMIDKEMATPIPDANPLPTIRQRLFGMEPVRATADEWIEPIQAPAEITWETAPDVQFNPNDTAVAAAAQAMNRAAEDILRNQAQQTFNEAVRQEEARMERDAAARAERQGQLRQAGTRTGRLPPGAFDRAIAEQRAIRRNIPTGTVTINIPDFNF